jgi:hypothetical protein
LLPVVVVVDYGVVAGPVEMVEMAVEVQAQ